MREKLLIITSLFLFFIIQCGDELTEFNFEPPTLISPQNGATLTENPPTFIWQSVDVPDTCDVVYRLEGASDSTFSQSAIIVNTMVIPPDTNYTHYDTFTSGDYYWHVCTRENA